MEEREGRSHWAQLPGKGDDTVGNPSLRAFRAQLCQFEFFELILLLLKFNKQLPVEQFGATVSYLSQRYPPPLSTTSRFPQAAPSARAASLPEPGPGAMVVYVLYGEDEEHHLSSGRARHRAAASGVVAFPCAWVRIIYLIIIC